MKNHNRTRWLASSFICLALVGCATTHGTQPQNLEAPLFKLTTAVAAEVRYPKDNVRVADDQLIAYAMKDKPELQKAFQGVSIKIWHDDKYVVLMICSPDGSSCWLEDASWTTGIDRRCYQRKPLPPAEFTLPQNAPSLRPQNHPEQQPIGATSKAGP